jgi:hypothetical protein
MRRILLVAICIFGSLPRSSLAHGVTIIEIRNVIHANSLAGIVTFRDPSDGVPGVVVEDCTRGWAKVVETSLTDENGNFKLPAANRRSVHYLRISKVGWDTLLVKVMIDRRAGELVLNLRPST